MINNKKIRWVLFISLTIIASFTFGSIYASAHDPRYLDLKYYEDENTLSVYVTHGVSDRTYHYINRVTVEIYELPASLIEDFETDPKWILVSADQRLENEKFGPYWIEKGDVFDEVDLSVLNRTLEIDEQYDEQLEDQINHYNYTMDYPEWTLMVVTAFCNIGGSFNNSFMVGHPWYDVEHHISEAIVPTIVCAIVIMSPLALWRIFGKKPEEVIN
jgi:hypothetical protein